MPDSPSQHSRLTTVIAIAGACLLALVAGLMLSFPAPAPEDEAAGQPPAASPALDSEPDRPGPPPAAATPQAPGSPPAPDSAPSHREQLHRALDPGGHESGDELGVPDILSAWALDDLEGLALLLAEHDQPDQAIGLAEVLAYGIIDELPPELAARLLQTLEDGQAPAFVSARARQLAEEDPHAAAAWLNDPAVLARSTDAAEYVAARLAHHDPGAVLPWLLGLPAHDHRSNAWMSAFQQLARDDPSWAVAGAAELVGIQDLDAESANHALRGLAAAIAEADPDLALGLADAIHHLHTRFLADPDPVLLLEPPPPAPDP
ncbi:MAG: hypothetical protein EA425_12175 [Puniceicoccaceae bacterium]|nr:MAG: hypothetical protein EA425_12175 [Puniceicoccaceae bacterium]